MPSTSHRASTSVVVGFAVAWGYLLLAGWVVEQPYIGVLVLSVAYIVTFYVQMRHLRRGGSFSLTAGLVALLPAAMFCFVIWGFVLTQVPMGLAGKNAPDLLRFSAMLLPAAAGVVAVALLLLPFVGLFGHRLLVAAPVAGASLIWVMQGVDLLAPDPATITTAVMVLESLSLTLIAPVLLHHFAPLAQKSLYRRFPPCASA